MELNGVFRRVGIMRFLTRALIMLAPFVPDLDTFASLEVGSAALPVRRAGLGVAVVGIGVAIGGLVVGRRQKRAARNAAAQQQYGQPQQPGR